MSQQESGLFNKNVGDFDSFSRKEQAFLFLGQQKYTDDLLNSGSYGYHIEVIFSEFSKLDYHVPHDFVAKVIYRSDGIKNISDNELFSKNQHVLIKYFERNNFSKTNINRIKINFQKVYDSVMLSIVQKEYIWEQASSVIEEAKKLRDENKKLQKELQKANRLLKEMKLVKGSIYTDFIAILGVFSAFVFLAFGGLSIVQATYDLGGDLLVIPISKMLLISSLMLMIVLTLMYSFLYWLSKVIDREFEKHKYYILLMSVLSLIVFIVAFINNRF